MLTAAEKDVLNRIVSKVHLANASWWIDLETGQDVRTWPKTQFNLWIASKLMLMVTEISEGMEGLRKDLYDDKLPTFKMLPVEVVDSVIRAFDLLGGLGFNVAEIMDAKLEFNAKREDHKLDNRKLAGGKSI